nr:MAG TPA: hypothetical protein [Caudoviricetes sp.]
MIFIQFSLYLLVAAYLWIPAKTANCGNYQLWMARSEAAKR